MHYCREIEEDRKDPEAAFNAEQNALVAVRAEQYYRTMVGGGPESWNLRDTHMADTLDRIMVHYGSGAKGIIWAHNTHVGDANATDMASAGMINIGQLVGNGIPGNRSWWGSADMWGALSPPMHGGRP